MLEYGIKQVTTNPTLISKADEVIRLVDSRTHRTRAFVIPAKYEKELAAFFKRIAHRKWLEEKKKALKKSRKESLPDDLMEKGWEGIEEYLDDAG